MTYYLMHQTSTTVSCILQQEWRKLRVRKHQQVSTFNKSFLKHVKQKSNQRQALTCLLNLHSI